MRTAGLSVLLALAVVACLNGCAWRGTGGAMDPPDSPPLPSGELKDGVRVVDFDAFRYGYSPDPLVVRAGEPVRLRATSRDTTHGFGLEAIKFEATISPGPRKDIEFTAPVKPGKYDFHCTVFCGLGHMGMKGTLLVLPPAAQ